MYSFVAVSCSRRIEQTTSTPTLSVWRNFALTQTDDAHPIPHRVHVAIRVGNVEASTAFYSTIGDAAGLTLQRQSPDGAAFAVGASGGSLLIFADGQTQNIHLAFSGKDDDVRGFHADATAAGYHAQRRLPRGHLERQRTREHGGNTSAGTRVHARSLVFGGYLRFAGFSWSR